MELQVLFNDSSPRHRIPCVLSSEDMTIPDDSLTIKDILYRFSRGLPLDVHVNSPIYDDVDDDDFETNPMNEHLEMDEIYREAENASETIDNYNTLIENGKQNESPTPAGESDQSSAVSQDNK